MKLPTENDVKNAVLGYLALRQIPAVRLNTGAFAGEYRGRKRFVRFGVKGMSDILAILPPIGRAFWIETKRIGNKATAEQLAFQECQRQAGALCVIAYGVDDVARVLANYP